MAAALAATGVVLLRARGALDRRMTGLRPNRALAAMTHAATALNVTIGVYLTAGAAVQL